jgi:hypothetical protein
VEILENQTKNLYVVGAFTGLPCTFDAQSYIEVQMSVICSGRVGIQRLHQHLVIASINSARSIVAL